MTVRNRRVARRLLRILRESTMTVARGGVSVEIACSFLLKLSTIATTFLDRMVLSDFVNICCRHELICCGLAIGSGSNWRSDQRRRYDVTIWKNTTSKFVVAAGLTVALAVGAALPSSAGPTKRAQHARSYSGRVIIQRPVHDL